MKTPLTARQRRIMAAIRAGHRTTRALMEAAGVSSTSVVAAELERLAAAEHIVLVETRRGTELYLGTDFSAAWDASARLAGNPDA